MSDHPDTDSADAHLLHEALAEAGCDVRVAEELRTLTASAEGGAFFALVIFVDGARRGWNAFCTRLGNLLGDDAHDGLKSLFSRRQVIIRGDELSAVLDCDVPPDAVTKLSDSPDAPSGELIWDRDDLCWRDALE